VLNRCDILLIGTVRFLVAVVAAGSDCDPPGALVLPLLSPLVPFIVPLLVALDGVAQLLLGTIFLSPRTKTVMAASSPEACRVVISRSSLVVSD
jgi:hypothetical protein